MKRRWRARRFFSKCVKCGRFARYLSISRECDQCWLERTGLGVVSSSPSQPSPNSTLLSLNRGSLD